MSCRRPSSYQASGKASRLVTALFRLAMARVQSLRSSATRASRNENSGGIALVVRPIATPRWRSARAKAPAPAAMVPAS